MTEDQPPTDAELDYLCTDCGCSLRVHMEQGECEHECVGANAFMPPEYPDDLPQPEMTIDQALAIERDWHGIEPCEDCGVNHTPVWWHVDFTEDSHLAELLRARANQVIERLAPPDTPDEDCDAFGYCGRRLAVGRAEPG